jgi:DNA-directed RNA polymerase specialized sigma24 family protein
VLWQAIEGLPTDLKMALLLREIVGFSYSEIAEALEITLSTVKWRIFSAREALVLVLSRAEEDVLTAADAVVNVLR